jgi:endonuclease/exonuclease/phosphatase (EEP) superfamily protein YafD
MTSRLLSPLPEAPLHLTRRAAWLLFAGIAIPAMLVSSRLLSPYALIFDLMANVSYFAAIPLAVAAIWAGVTRQWWLTAVAMGLAAAAASPILLGPECTKAAAEECSSAKLLFCNIGGQVQAVEPLLALIAKEQPDMVAIVEAHKAVVERLLASRFIVDLFPFRVTPRIGLEWPHVILSRHPFEPIALQDPQKRYRSLFTFHRAVVVTLPAGRLVFSTEHLPSPRRASSWKDGNARIKLLGEVTRDHLCRLGVPIVIAGDFNTTPSGYRHRLLHRETGLRPDPIGSVPVGTWPSWLPDYCRLPIDRVWGSNGIAFLSSRVLDEVGSDHRPVSVTFRVAQ